MELPLAVWQTQGPECRMVRTGLIKTVCGFCSDYIWSIVWNYLNVSWEWAHKTLNDLRFGGCCLVCPVGSFRTTTTRMFLEVLWSLLLLDFGTVQASVVSRDTGKATLKISTKINTTGFSNLVEKDRARAQALKQLPHLRERTASSGSFSATNAAVFYTAEVGVGTPPTNRMFVICPFLQS